MLQRGEDGARAGAARIAAALAVVGIAPKRERELAARLELVRPGIVERSRSAASNASYAARSRSSVPSEAT